MIPDTILCDEAIASTYHFSPVILQDQSCKFEIDEIEEPPGYVPDLATCSQLCEASSRCQSASLYPSGFCNHFNTCTNLVSTPGSVTVIFESDARSAVDWTLVGYGKACDADAGEFSLQSSPGKIETLARCLELCEQSLFDCRSVSFLANDFCDHFSTTCETTKAVPNAASFRITSTGAVAVSARAVANTRQHVVVNAQPPTEVANDATTAESPYLVSIAMVLILSLM